MTCKILTHYIERLFSYLHFFKFKKKNKKTRPYFVNYFQHHLAYSENKNYFLACLILHNYSNARNLY